MLVVVAVIPLLTCLLSPVISRVLGRGAGWFLAIPLLVAAGLLVAASGFAPDAIVDQYLPWMPSIGVGLALRVDGIALLFGLLVLVIGAGVLIYATRYLGTHGQHGSFYGWLTGFAAAMLILVLADDLVLMFVAWEATTLCSFFLIARSGEHARQPAIRTLLVTVAGGLSLLAAVTLVAASTGTTRLSAVLADPIWAENAGFTVAVAALVAGAAFTKSAQFPFQSWLPDSMVAITPVSAYLHAAAMVKAGIYLLLRFSPVFAGETVWSVLLITGGLVTALLGAVSALRRHDLKELLAYSTMSQLGLIVALIGVGTPAALTAAVAHTIAHALFKSALFMLVGVIDHQAGTRDIRALAGMRLRMPFTAAGLVLAAASMAGIPLLLGFVSKEMMFAAMLDAHGPAWVPVLITIATAVTAVLTFAYSARIVLGAFAGRDGAEVSEGSVAFWTPPLLAAAAGLALGVVPFVLDRVVTAAATVVGSDTEAHLVLWHGLVPALGVSALVLTAGTLVVLGRRRVDRLLAPLRFPFSGLAIIEALRAGTIRIGVVVGGWAGTRAPRRHLTIPAVCLVVIAGIAVFTMDALPPVVDSPSRATDWVLVALIAAGVLATVRARTRIAAVVVVGVVGFTMTLWFFVLGAADVALTQLLVEILTVCVMVLLLSRLPRRFRRERARRSIPAAVIALGAGAATTLGVWALTGRRELSPAAEYYLTTGEQTTGGANIVNTILVDFRALDTLGELTVLGVAGLAVAALLHARRPTPTRVPQLVDVPVLADAHQNTVFVRTIMRTVVPLIVVLSVILLFRGHQEPGGGFIAALVGGAGFALRYLAAPSDAAGRIRLPYLALIGAGVTIGAGTGFLGYIQGSFLTPLHAEVLGFALTTALVFDIGVYLAVIGLVLTAFNLLGRQLPVPETPQLKERVR